MHQLFCPDGTSVEDTTLSNLSVEEKNQALNEVLENLIEIVEKNGDSIIDTFGISLAADGSCQFTQTDETQRLRFLADIYGYASTDELSEEEKSKTAEEVLTGSAADLGEAIAGD